MHLQINKKKIVKRIIVIVILFGSWSLYQFISSPRYFYVQRDYLGITNNTEEIVEIVENFDYDSHLHISPDPWGIRFVNFSNNDVLNKLADDIEKTRLQYFLAAPMSHSILHYTFLVQNSSYFYFENQSNELEEIEFIIKSEIINVTLTDETEDVIPSWYINGSYFPLPVVFNENISIANVIITISSFSYSLPNTIRVENFGFNQLVVLTLDLDVLFVMIFDYYQD